jgi:diguanylate cyclase (GGDEF)-like protein
MDTFPVANPKIHRRSPLAPEIMDVRPTNLSRKDSLLRVWSKGALKSWLLPGGLLLIAAVLVSRESWLSITVSIVDLYYYAAFGAGLLLAWRFHNGRTLSAVVVLLLSNLAIQFFTKSPSPTARPGLTALEAVSFLLPVNIALIASGWERGFAFSSMAPRFLLLFVESVFVAMICSSPSAPGASLFHGALLNRDWFSWTRIPQISWLAFVVTLGILIYWYATHRKVVESGLAWALGSSFLAMNSPVGGHLARAYFATAAVILVASIIETSYSMAYHDELTGLPARRAFNEASLGLELPYAVAVVDIDHFKKFNDTYGHDIGDDVLCLVAGRLSGVTGGGKAFRIGGEEFTILFPGKKVEEVVEHVELLRATIERSTFRLRGSDRRTTQRGSDRRKSPSSRRKNAARPRQTSASSSTKELSVTVSIGVAGPDAKHSDMTSVLKVADQALYRAKESGRNRVEVGPVQSVRTKKKAARTTS